MESEWVLAQTTKHARAARFSFANVKVREGVAQGSGPLAAPEA